jgi:hypothetical protein
MVSKVDASAPKVEYIEGGVDWITATLPSASMTTELWLQRCIRVLEAIAKEGNELKPRTMQGYYGLSAGNCFAGSREDGTMIQLTGSYANEHFASIDRPDLHYSRVDVQTTAKFVIMPTTIAQGAYDNAASANALLPAPRRRKLVIIRGSDGGDTFYLGSASSDQRGRIYNKAVQSESPHYNRCWRYEIVYRNTLATQIARSCPYALDKRAKWAAQVVNSWYQARGVPDCGYDAGFDITLPLSRPLPTDVERKLRWLEKQVRPTIKYLIEQGYRDTILTSLGLSDQISTNSPDY